MKVSVLIPAYNEAKNIGTVVRHAIRTDVPVLVVDDGSRDGTGDIARYNGADILTHEEKMGKGASIRDGLEELKTQALDGVIIMDGDGQHDPSDIARFIQRAEETGADLVIGDRMQDAGHMPLVRRLTNIVMSRIISGLAGQNLPDTQTGFRFLRMSFVRAVPLDSDNYEIESEMLMKACRRNLRIASVPIQAVYRGQKSNINPLIDTIRFVRLVIRSFSWR